ncbi:hypothetical protein HDU81_002517 [Chytriomyces hyalinus]|nr:hypothetical protein HDU81_002517 [Chytriomyces hyalinus]
MTTWNIPDTDGWQFQLLGPQSKVGAGEQWYFRADGSINGDTGLLPDKNKISVTNQGAVDGKPVIGVGSGVVGNNVPNTPGKVNLIQSGGADWPSWVKPTIAGGAALLFLILCAFGTWCYSSRKRAQEDAEDLKLEQAKRAERERLAREPKKVFTDEEPVVDYADLTGPSKKQPLYEDDDSHVPHSPNDQPQMQPQQFGYPVAYPAPSQAGGYAPSVYSNNSGFTSVSTPAPLGGAYPPQQAQPQFYPGQYNQQQNVGPYAGSPPAMPFSPAPPPSARPGQFAPPQVQQPAVGTFAPAPYVAPYVAPGQQHEYSAQPAPSNQFTQGAFAQPPPRTQASRQQYQQQNAGRSYN